MLSENFSGSIPNKSASTPKLATVFSSIGAVTCPIATLLTTSSMSPPAANVPAALNKGFPVIAPAMFIKGEIVPIKPVSGSSMFSALPSTVES